MGVPFTDHQRFDRLGSVFRSPTTPRQNGVKRDAVAAYEEALPVSGEHSASRRGTAETRGGEEPGRKSRTAAVAGTSSMASCAKQGNHDGAEGWLESPGGRSNRRLGFAKLAAAG